jgi:tetratricopeptide (TPR) repeat protein
MAPLIVPTVSQATVRVSGLDGRRVGQGLGVRLRSGKSILLTCHHVIAPLLGSASILVDIFRDDIPVQRAAVVYNPTRSDPGQDLAVCDFLDPIEMPCVPLARLNAKYTGRWPVVGITRPMEGSQRFNALLAESTPLTLNIREFQGTIPTAFRLVEPTDSRPGISGSPIILADAVIGLTHFSRAENIEWAREIYAIPIASWFPKNPELLELSSPFIDPALRRCAVVRRGRDLQPLTDFELAKYSEHIEFRRSAVKQVLRRLKDGGTAVILGRPHSGKTWIAYRAAREWQGWVVLPKENRPPAEFDDSALAGTAILLVIDDAQDLSPDFDFSQWPKALTRKGANGKEHRPSLMLVCRDGPDLQNLKDRAPWFNRYFESEGEFVYASRVGRFGKDVTPSEAAQFAVKVGLTTAEWRERFDGTIGSLVLNLGEMRHRYELLRKENLGDIRGTRLLDSIKLLREGHCPFSEKYARMVAEKIRGEDRFSQETWDELKRVTAEAGFGAFDESGWFTTYKPYIDECVQYEPSNDDLSKLGPILAEIGDVDSLTSLGFWLLERGSEAGADICLQAAKLGSQSAIKIILLFIGRFRAFFFLALRWVSGLVRAGESSYLQTLGVLYERRGKFRWAACAYREALKAGYGDAREQLGMVLLRTASTKEEGRELLIDEAFCDETGNIAFWLGTALQDCIGYEAETEELLRFAIDRGHEEVRYYLGRLYVEWPGRYLDAKRELSRAMQIYERSNQRILLNVAIHTMFFGANIAGDKAEIRRLRPLHDQAAREHRRSVDQPPTDPNIVLRGFPTGARLTNKDGDKEPDRVRETISITESQMVRPTDPDPIRYDVFRDGWDAAWAADEFRILAARIENEIYLEAGYDQSNLILGALSYRAGARDEAEASLTKSGLDRSTQHPHWALAALLLAGILLDRGSWLDFAVHIESTFRKLEGMKRHSFPRQFVEALRILRTIVRGDVFAPDFPYIARRTLAAVWLSVDLEQPSISPLTSDLGAGPAAFEYAKWQQAVRPFYEQELASALHGRWSQTGEAASCNLAYWTAILEKLLHVGSATAVIVAKGAERHINLLVIQGSLHCNLHLANISYIGSDRHRHFAAMFFAILAPVIRRTTAGSNLSALSAIIPCNINKLTGPELAILCQILIEAVTSVEELLLSEDDQIQIDMKFHNRYGIVVSFARGGGKGQLAEKQAAEETEVRAAVARTVARFERALELHSHRVSPVRWATVHNYLGVYYSRIEAGNRHANVETAIEHWKASSEFFTVDKFPNEWAELQEQIGHAFLRGAARAPGYISEAISSFEGAAQIFNRSKAPFKWATLQDYLGTCYRQLWQGDRLQNLKKSIGYCNQALEVFRLDHYPADWAEVNENLGHAYVAEAEADPEALSRAISAYRATLRVWKRETASLRWAAVQDYLGECYRRLQQGQRELNISVAKSCFDSALEVYRENEHQKDWVLVKLHLGYLLLDQSDSGPENIDQALAHFTNAEKYITADEDSSRWAAVKGDLSACYRALQRGACARNIAKAISLCQEALGRIGEDTEPRLRSFIQEQIGLAYLAERPIRGDASVAEAVKYLSSALEMRNTIAERWRIAALNSHLGSAFCAFTSEDRDKYLITALSYFEAALQVFSKTAWPRDWGYVQAGIGRAKLDRARLGLQSEATEALDCLHAALGIFSRSSEPRRWALIQNDIGEVFCQLSSNDPQYLNLAVSSHRIALDTLDETGYPQDSAEIRYCLGRTYVTAYKAGRADCLTLAHEEFQNALSFFSQTDFPQRWQEITSILQGLT